MKISSSDDAVGLIRDIAETHKRIAERIPEEERVVGAFASAFLVGLSVGLQHPEWGQALLHLYDDGLAAEMKASVRANVEALVRGFPIEIAPNAL